jgi:hypothetical protein
MGNVEGLAVYSIPEPSAAALALFAVAVCGAAGAYRRRFPT